MFWILSIENLLFQSLKALYDKHYANRVEPSSSDAEPELDDYECFARTHESRVTRKGEIEEYLNEPRVKVKPADEKNFHILDWWNTAQSKYSNLSRMARDILAIPVSSVASDQ
ncbi:hypothetical protein PsorP6_016707 [Peronosclerospora sorghi]|uniref:Uncharacterized protein n=1 Tax=Peronosclerospora sorghi TaxID=230839 RepID=A0ACC0WCS9_9STRA|nr:hypothetical protein PsorP6_016707 [Peronosclerospora sorghi]